ncbi:MAG TPA: ABC transporter permease [Candidatus Kapabacteria bacterium]|nr:ABC transporter permease [Candidatus Kapabacteria bacterium]
MQFSRTYAIVLRYFYLLRGSLTRIVPLFVWGIIDIILWGFITKYLNSVSNSRFSFVPTLLGAVLLWDYFIRVMYGVTTTFFEDVWSRNFLNMFASPISISEYLAGVVSVSIITSSIGLLAMLVLSLGIFGLSFFSIGALFIPFLLILILFGISFGIFACAIVLRLGPASEWFIWPIPAVLAPFAGVFYPISTLPQWMRFVSYLLPPSYVFEGMRAALFDQPISATAIFIGCALSVFYIFLASWYFLRVYRYAVRSGLIARYSAESIP